MKKRKPANPFTAWRKRHKLSQRAAARTIGASRGAWMAWEQANEAPGYIRLAMLAVDAGIRLKPPPD